MAPTHDELEVALEALRAEARVWDEQSNRLGELSGLVRTMDFSRVQAGVFQLVVGAHADLVAHLSARCAEGGTETASIAERLRATAQAYADEEAHNCTCCAAFTEEGT